MKSIENIIIKNPEIKYIGLFGSRVRNTNFLNSDVDLILLGNLKQDIKEIEDEVEQYFSAPRADIYLLQRESIEYPTVNPKTITMGLDIKELWRNKEEKEVKFDMGKVDLRLFCAFLEYERLRTLAIFEGKESTHDYIKKMPGGRRSYDEIIWLSKLIKNNINLPLKFEDYLNKLRLEILSKNWNNEIKTQRAPLDEIIFDLECNLIEGLKTAKFRGGSSLEYLFPNLKKIFYSSDTMELKNIYNKNQDLESPNSWLIQYGLAFNSNISPNIAERIALTKRTDLFDYEIKKSLLQNKIIKNPSFSRTIKILCEDSYPLIRRYANLIKDPNYLQNFPINQREFLKNNINHIL